MTLDEMLNSLFPKGHAVQRGPFNTLQGSGNTPAGDVAIVGISDGAPVGIDNTLVLAGHVLSIIGAGGNMPIVVLIDAAIQKMARRDELLGLPEYFGHLYKVLVLAGLRGHRTIAVLYGPAAGGSLIAAALAVQSLVTVPGGEPSVMDLPSIARVTKLPLPKLQQMAKATPIFAPGIDNYFLTGAVEEKWDPKKPLADQLASLMKKPADAQDRRDKIGFERKGRLQAVKIAERVAMEASGA
jgi:malonate decarboxylase gamma subunit